MGLAAVTYDNQATLKEFATRYSIGYPLLADAGSKVIRAFNLLNPDNTVNNIPDYGMLDTPYPGYLFIDPAGIVREKFFEDAYSDRYTANNVMLKLFPGLAEPANSAAKVPHLSVFLGQSDRSAVPGSRVTLIADVVLPKGIHVYAPGTKPYKPIQLALDAAPEFKLRDTIYPKAKIMRFTFTKEKVPVYEGRFRITQDILLEGRDMDFIKSLGRKRTDPPRILALKGVLRYQACDDSKCFMPTEVPLSWQLQVHQMDWKRVSSDAQRKE